MDRPKTRVCSKCGKRKPLTRKYFPPVKWNVWGLNTLCYVCLRIYNKDLKRGNYWKNPKLARAKGRLSSKKYKESVQRSQRKYHLKNAKQINIRQKDAWHRHSFLTRARGANTWARKRGSQGIVTAQDIARIYHRQRGRCFYCETRLDRQFEVDHKIPLDRKGPNTPRNLCCTCHKCNKRKQNKSVEEFRKILKAKYGLPEPELASLRVA